MDILTLYTSLFGDAAWEDLDSLDKAELVVKTGLSITDEEMAQCKNLEDFVKLVEEKQ